MIRAFFNLFLRRREPPPLWARVAWINIVQTTGDQTK